MTQMLNPADDAFEARLRALLPAVCFKEDTARYFEENRGRWTGHGLVVAPGSTEEVAQIVSTCAAARVGIIPYGGGTGLVGGQLTAEGARPVVLTLERMSAVRAVFPDENVIVVDAGIVLADVQAAAEKVDRLFPLSLASEGSARIGGLLATNAGGINTLRYGNARAMVLGLEVVCADGTIWNGLSRLRKDNTGYDLKNLMIGSEGTLGVITGAALQLSPKPTSVGTAVFDVRDPAAALRLLSLARGLVGEGISAFELMHRQGMEFLSEAGIEVRAPFAAPPEWTVLIELGLSAGAEAEAALGSLFELALEEGVTTDAVIAQSVADRQAFWQIRELIPEANRKIGAVSSHDISLPLSTVPAFIDKGRDMIAGLGAFRINCFGHLGDGNLHYNVFPVKGRSRQDHMAERDQIKKTVHDLVHRFGGSVSAEHGVGRLKVTDLERYSDPAKLAMLRAIKRGLDPSGIMNPGAVLRL